jgi:diguanylate cyclase (GGDEF)-like protein
MQAALISSVVVTTDVSHTEEPEPTGRSSRCTSCGRPDTDPLTGLLDRWRWASQAQALVEARKDPADPVVLLLADLDRFKSVNDSVGHVAGDAVLAAVAGAIQSEARTHDLWGRYGSYAGDEFIGLLPHTSLSAATNVTERLQRRVSALHVLVSTPLGNHDISGVSISIGLAWHQPGHSLDATLRRADFALLAAKRNGGHCACVANADSHMVITHPGRRGLGNERHQHDHVR